jgi:hypothetical protein
MAWYFFSGGANVFNLTYKGGWCDLTSGSAGDEVCPTASLTANTPYYLLVVATAASDFTLKVSSGAASPTSVAISGTLSPSVTTGTVAVWLTYSSSGSFFEALALPSGSSVPFTFYAPANLGSASITVFNDANGDGLLDSGEATHANSTSITIGSSDITGLAITIP